jgi:hypothetical protein
MQWDSTQISQKNHIAIAFAAKKCYNILNTALAE